MVDFSSVYSHIFLSSEPTGNSTRIAVLKLGKEPSEKTSKFLNSIKNFIGVPLFSKFDLLQSSN